MIINREKNFFLRSEKATLERTFLKDKSNIAPGLLKALKTTALCAYVLMLVMQIRNLIVFNGEPISDALNYLSDAYRQLDKGTWYPTADDFIGGGVAGTGLINYFIFLLRIVSDLRIIYLGNFLLVELMLFSTVYIAEKITGSRIIRYITVTVFCLFATFWAEICIARTEIFFTALATFALALAVKNSKFSLIVAGAVLAYAHWARPLSLAFIVAIVWLFIVRGDKPVSYIKFFAGFFCIVAILTAFTYVNSGKAIFSPTIANGNFLMGANADADGSYDNTVFDEGKAGYIPPEERAEMSVEEINAVYKNAAMTWIKENPVDYLLLLPRKLFYFLATDTYSGDVYFDNKIQTGGISYIRSLFDIITGKGERAIQFGDIIVIYNQAFYMLVLLLFFVGVICSMKNGWWRTMSFLYGIFLIGVAASLYTVGAARYHFPYLPVMIITASAFIDSFIKTISCSKTKKSK